MTNINKINQSGRSMVEMLGVLAIIGVLSVGGIAGYTTAMNKHRANEILNAASVRAMMITTQLAQGRKAAELSLAEFGEEKVQGVSFDKEYTDGAETFNLKLTWDAANPSVCTQIKNIVGENVTVDTECTTFTYKNEFGIQNGTNESKSSAGESCGEDGECASNKCGSSGICCSSSISTETSEVCCRDLGGHWCSSDNACHPQSEECPPITGGNKVAGDWCYEDGECASNKCGSGGICCSSSISTETNEPCCYDLGGHWCWDNKCRSQSEACPFKSSGAACWNDSECEFGCDYGTMTCN